MTSTATDVGMTPRIQILELPTDTAGPYATTPFVIVVDGVTEEYVEVYRDAFEGLKVDTGARAVLMLDRRIQV